MPYLAILSLAHNALSGSFPLEITNIATLERLDLSHNQLSGPLPPELAHLTKIYDLNLSYNQFTGSLPPELGEIDFGYVIGPFWQSGVLDLSYNQLSGSLPPELGHPCCLGRLDLAGNQFSGAVPSSLAGLEFLGRPGMESIRPVDVSEPLDLGYNRLDSSGVPNLLAFLSLHDPDWDETQTVPVTQIEVSLDQRRVEPILGAHQLYPRWGLLRDQHR